MGGCQIPMVTTMQQLPISYDDDDDDDAHETKRKQIICLGFLESKRQAFKKFCDHREQIWPMSFHDSESFAINVAGEVFSEKKYIYCQKFPKKGVCILSNSNILSGLGKGQK